MTETNYTMTLNMSNTSPENYLSDDSEDNINMFPRFLDKEIVNSPKYNRQKLAFKTLDGHLLNKGRGQTSSWKKGLRNRNECNEFDEKYLDNKRKNQYLKKCYAERRNDKYTI